MCLAAGESIYTSTIIYLRPNGKKRNLVGQREMCIESSQHGFLCFNFRKSIEVIVLTILQIENIRMNIYFNPYAERSCR